MNDYLPIVAPLLALIITTYLKGRCDQRDADRRRTFTALPAEDRRRMGLAGGIIARGRRDSTRI